MYVITQEEKEKHLKLYRDSIMVETSLNNTLLLMVVCMLIARYIFCYCYPTR